MAALCDSGNLVGNAMSEDCAKKVIGEARMNDLLPVNSTIRTCNKGKGGQVNVLGRVRKPIRLDFGRGITFPICPLVIRNFSSDFNISGKFLAANKIDQLHSRGCLWYDGKMIPMLRRIPKKWRQESGDEADDSSDEELSALKEIAVTSQRRPVKTGGAVDEGECVSPGVDWEAKRPSSDSGFRSWEESQQIDQEIIAEMARED